jgi:hypothetical protein
LHHGLAQCKIDGWNDANTCTKRKNLNYFASTAQTYSFQKIIVQWEITQEHASS